MDIYLHLSSSSKATNWDVEALAVPAPAGDTVTCGAVVVGAGMVGAAGVADGPPSGPCLSTASSMAGEGEATRAYHNQELIVWPHVHS